MADEPSVIYNTTTQTCLTKARPDVDGDCSSASFWIQTYPLTPQILQVFSYLCLVTHTSHFLLLVLLVVLCAYEYVSVCVCVCILKWLKQMFHVPCVRACVCGQESKTRKGFDPKSKWKSHFALIAHVFGASE